MIFTNFAKKYDVLEANEYETVSALEEDRKYDEIATYLYGRGCLRGFRSDKKDSQQVAELSSSQQVRRGFAVLRTVAASYGRGYSIRRFAGASELFGFSRDEIREWLEQQPTNVPKGPSNLARPEHNFLTNKKLRDTILDVGRYNDNPRAIAAWESNTFGQNLYNEPDDGDEQKDLHIDTFFPCLKFWWFPDAVTADQGAFRYAEGSHALTDQKLKWIWEQSINIAENNVEPWRGRGHAEGSYRISEEELASMGWTARPIEVGADTLVVANVSAFHGRGHTVGKPHRRLAMHGSIRIRI